MRNQSNSIRAGCIHIAIVVLSFFLITLFSIDFESGEEVWLAILLAIIYIICGFILMDFRQKKAFKSLCLFFIFFIVISVILVITNSLLILVWNPVGLVLVDNILPYNLEVHMAIVYIVAGTVPLALFYSGLKLRTLWEYIKISRRME